MLRYQLKNTLLTPTMAVAVFAQCFFMLTGLYPMINPDLVYDLQQSMTLGYGWLMICVTSVLPLCFFLHYGGRRQTLCLAVSRSSYRVYIKSVILTAILSGMAVALGACVVFTFLCMLLCKDGAPFFGAGLGAQLSGVWGWLSQHPGLRYAAMCGIYTIQGGLWPVISLSCFGLSQNAALAAALPFTLRTILNYLAQMLELTLLSPAMTRLVSTAAVQLPVGGFVYLLLYVLLIWCVCIGVWLFHLHREVRRG